MKILNTRIMAQAVVGSTANTAALLNDPNVGAGWNIFAFNGKVPTSDAGFAAAFNQKSLADMYNQSLGIVRNPVTGIESGNVIAMTLQSQYVPKGVSYYGTIGSTAANVISVTQLLPARVTRTGFTDRCITWLLGSGSVPMPSGRMDGSVIDFEFDEAVTWTHIKWNTTTALSGNTMTLWSVADDGTETAMGTYGRYDSLVDVSAIQYPQRSKKYRLKNLTGAQYVFTMLSSVDAAPTAIATAPTWAALAHCNTLTHGDIDYSDNIMFAAGACGNQGPFKIVGDVVPNKKNVMFCPKLRFTPRSA